MKLFFREYGEGRPFIILHGILGISDNWITFARRMAKHSFRVIIPDHRNHGQSPHHYAINYYALVDDLVELIEENGLEMPVIMGHSMGGKVAMRYALENPDLVDRLIVVDTSLRTYVRFNYHQRLIDAMLSVDFDAVRSRQEAGDHLAGKVESQRIRQFLLKNLHRKEDGRLGWRINLEAISDNLDSMYDGIFYSARFERPALFIRGGDSDYIIDEDFPAIDESFPQAQIETIAGGTHWVHADAPEEFYGMVTSFLDVTGS
jgi:esterase